MSPLRSKEILELGSRLVAQLDRKDDLLAAWMSHYIAELIDNVEKATPEARLAAQAECAKAIIALWRRRSSWPEKVRPFLKLEPALRILASLDVEQSTERYCERELIDALAKADDETRTWLDFAGDVDRAARYLIGTALRAATKANSESLAPWVALAKDAEIDDSVETELLEFVIDAPKSGDAAKVRESIARLSLSKIETFLKTGAAFVDELRSLLDDGGDGGGGGVVPEDCANGRPDGDG